MPLLLVFIALFFYFSSVSCEIEQVTLHWDAKLCKDQCALRLERSLKNLQGVAEAQVDAAAGQATFRWKPRSRFFFQDINSATRVAGLKDLQVGITVRGVISHAGKRFTLESLGDNTMFELYSPPRVAPTATKTTTPPNLDQYGLDPEAQKHLINNENGSYVVTVTGVLLQPERSPPNRLVISSIQGGVPDQTTQQTPVQNQLNTPARR